MDNKIDHLKKKRIELLKLIQQRSESLVGIDPTSGNYNHISGQQWINIYDYLDQINDIDSKLSDKMDRYPENKECQFHGHDSDACLQYSGDACCEPEADTYINVTNIIVPTEHDKEQLLMAFKYIHDLKEIDTDYKAVNTVCHIYERPELIIVQKD